MQPSCDFDKHKRGECGLYDAPHASQAEHPKPATSWADVAESVAFFIALSFVIWVLFA